jgi:hypothetical protein
VISVDVPEASPTSTARRSSLPSTLTVTWVPPSSRCTARVLTESTSLRFFTMIDRSADVPEYRSSRLPVTSTTTSKTAEPDEFAVASLPTAMTVP